MKTVPVSIITVTRNNLAGLGSTIASVRSQTFQDFEHIIIDGASTDGTLEQLKESRSPTTFILSEPDEGIYDAMNKGIEQASSPWLIFMNGGDRFANPKALAAAMSFSTQQTDVIYSDVILERDGKHKLVRCDLDQRRFHHQAIIYRKSLHDKYGRYVVAPGMTISDYLFFNSVAHLRWVKCDTPIAICDATGQSSKPTAYYQKLAIDLVLGLKPPIVIAIMLCLYPGYRIFIKPLVLRIQRWTNRTTELGQIQVGESGSGPIIIDDARSTK